MSFLRFAAFGVAGFAILDNCFQILIFSGASMEPTIHDESIGIGEKVTSYQHLRRGDIITAVAPDDPSMLICKRIVALGGDRVTYTPPNAEMLADEDGRNDFLTLRRFVPRGHVWVEGDNSKLSCDSRVFGPLPLGLIQSRVFLKVFPVKDFAVFIRRNSADEGV